MKNEQEQLEALKDIRNMMKESSKFLSLSGLSGVFAGIYALAGAFLGHHYISQYMMASHHSMYDSVADENDPTPHSNLLLKLILISGVVLLLSVATAFIMSSRKARQLNQSLFDHTSKKLFWCMAVPLIAGGLFCLALIAAGMTLMTGPAMLLFYGMALLHSSKYTLTDIKYLGYLEIALGITASFFTGYSLLFWALGFGVLHIIYGSIVWFKYDRIS